MKNHVEIWLELLHGADTPKLDACIAHYAAKPQTPSCPTVLLYDQATSDRLYADPVVRRGLDAWDLGRVTAFDIVRWGRLIKKERT